MSRRPPALAAALFCFSPSLLAQAAPSAAPAAASTLTIQVGHALHPVSPTLYGLMTEEINYSYDGGLYAEMVRNRAMQTHDWFGLASWHIVHLGESNAAMTLDSAEGPSVALPQSLRLDIAQASSSSPAGVRNEGFWGMALHPSTTYTGSLHARAADNNLGPMTAELVNNNTGEVLASTSTEPLKTGWNRYEFTLRTTSTLQPSAENHLRLTVAHPGRLWLSLVSLFPPTFHNRPNGNRVDLMDMLASMHPRFLRMPGGNYLEGDEIQERFDWKSAIGPLVDRPTHRSPWNYQSSDGLGLLEFLEWTEDLKIQPVLAVYAGYSLKGGVVPPGPGLEPFVQDALDEIEFTTGDTKTKWGAVRARLGHPAPFPLTYVEVGNEDEFDKSHTYNGRFRQFFTAIKTRYPHLQIIATTPVQGVRPDLVDDHFYKHPDDFFNMTHHYDIADRSGPKIFVGEWATREGSPTTDLGAALADAAWMTGMERNSDLIVMAAYAPLFVNVNPGGMQWESDLIGYNALTSYGSPSFYAQSLFSEFLGTEVPASTFSPASPRVFYSVTESPAQGTLFLKLVNAESTAQRVDLHLEGVPHLAPEGTLVTLSGANPTATNSIDHPDRIVPVRSTLQDVSSTLSHTLPPFSIQVLVLHTR